MNIYAKIKGINYKPLLCAELQKYSIEDIEKTFPRKGEFIVILNNKYEVALSWWISAKRTRSYPYARVYNTLDFNGKKITVIPVFKDEGFDGDRDFLQWDTISLMNLLGVYVIIAYYKKAKRNPRYENKITTQYFDSQYVLEKLYNIIDFKSDAFHWNLQQTEKIGEIANTALESYENISRILGVKFHSFDSAINRINKISKSKDDFLRLSRDLAEKAQIRESLTTQPKELVNGTKASITIENFLGGMYFLTVDEVRVIGSNIQLIEAKHSKKSILPSMNDIRDGLIKMALFTNLSDLRIENKIFNPVPILKLTSDLTFNETYLKVKQKENLDRLRLEAEKNGFKLQINN